MNLLVLGSGTCVPSTERNAPGYHVRASGKDILVDCGSGTLRQLVRAGRSYMALDAVLVTHLHPDHISDLLALTHALKYTPGLTRKKNLLLISPADIGGYFHQAIYSVLSPPETFRLEFLDTEQPTDLGDCRITACPTSHSGKSAAFRIASAQGSVVFTGDTDYDPALVGFCQGTDILVADCSFPDAMKLPGHMIPRECGRLAREAEVKRLLLSHLYPTPDPDDVRVAQASREYAGPISLAEDLTEYRVE